MSSGTSRWLSETITKYPWFSRLLILFGGEIDLVVVVNVSDDKEEIVIAGVRLTLSNRGPVLRFVEHLRCPGCWSHWLNFRKSPHKHVTSLAERRKAFMWECGIEKVY